MNNLAAAYQASKRWQDAIALLDESLQIMIARFGQCIPERSP